MSEYSANVDLSAIPPWKAVVLAANLLAHAGSRVASVRRSLPVLPETIALARKIAKLAGESEVLDRDDIEEAREMLDDRNSKNLLVKPAKALIEASLAVAAAEGGSDSGIESVERVYEQILEAARRILGGSSVEFGSVWQEFMLRYREVADGLPSSPSLKSAISESPFTVLIDPGSARPEEIAEYLAELSTLYRMVGGSGITFTLTDVRQLKEELV